VERVAGRDCTCNLPYWGAPKEAIQGWLKSKEQISPYRLLKWENLNVSGAQIGRGACWRDYEILQVEHNRTPFFRVREETRIVLGNKDGRVGRKLGSNAQPGQISRGGVR